MILYNINYNRVIIYNIITLLFELGANAELLFLLLSKILYEEALLNGINGYSDNSTRRFAQEIRSMRVDMLCT